MSTGPPFFVATMGKPWAAACLNMRHQFANGISKYTINLLNYEKENTTSTSIKVSPNGSMNAGLMNTPCKIVILTSENLTKRYEVNSRHVNVQTTFLLLEFSATITMWKNITVAMKLKSFQSVIVHFMPVFSKHNASYYSNLKNYSLSWSRQILKSILRSVKLKQQSEH